MLQLGQVLKETYRVEKLLGSGGMAEVYLVLHTRLPRPYALKLLHVESAVRHDFAERLRREAEILAKLRNPHVVDAFDWDYTPDGQPYFVMEYLEGETLSSFLQRAGQLSVPVALNICAQIGEGLQAAHDAGVVHRDLKPANIFLDKNGGSPNFVKILDFGIAKVMRSDNSPIMTNAALMGTPGYMAPEQALSRTEQIDQRTDQFALAAIFHEMLTGKPAFYASGDNVYAILSRIIHETAEPLPHRQINKAVQRALSKNPEDRFPSLREFLAAVGSNTLTILGPPSTVPPAQNTPTERNGELTLPPQRKNKRTQQRLALFVAIGGLVGGGLWLGTHHNQTPPSAAPVSAPALPKEPAVNPLDDSPSPPVGKVSPPATTPPAEASVGPKQGSSNSVVSKASEPENPPTIAAKSEGAASPRPMIPPPNRPRPKAPAKAASSARRFVISGANAVQRVRLQECADKVLGPLSGLPAGTSIVLERSGSLQITDGPMSVRNSELTSCLRQVFVRDHIEIPGSVVINVASGQER